MPLQKLEKYRKTFNTIRNIISKVQRLRELRDRQLREREEWDEIEATLRDDDWIDDYVRSLPDDLGDNQVLRLIESEARERSIRENRSTKSDTDTENAGEGGDTKW